MGFDQVTCPPSQDHTEVPLPWENKPSAKSTGTSGILVWAWAPLRSHPRDVSCSACWNLTLSDTGLGSDSKAMLWGNSLCRGPLRRAGSVGAQDLPRWLTVLRLCGLIVPPRVDKQGPYPLTCLPWASASKGTLIPACLTTRGKVNSRRFYEGTWQWQSRSSGFPPRSVQLVIHCICLLCPALCLA